MLLNRLCYGFLGSFSGCWGGSHCLSENKGRVLNGAWDLVFTQEWCSVCKCMQDLFRFIEFLMHKQTKIEHCRTQPMHALTQSNRLAVLIFREYSEQIFDQLTTNRYVTRGTVKILLFGPASPTCSWVTCYWTLTSFVPWLETAPTAMILIQCWFCWLQWIDSELILDHFHVLVLHCEASPLFRCHCLSKKNLWWCSDTHRFCLHIKQLQQFPLNLLIHNQLIHNPVSNPLPELIHIFKINNAQLIFEKIKSFFIQGLCE